MNWKQTSKGYWPPTNVPNNRIIGIAQERNIQFNSIKEADEQYDLDIYWYHGKDDNGIDRWTTCNFNYLNKSFTIDWWCEITFNI